MVWCKKTELKLGLASCASLALFACETNQLALPKRPINSIGVTSPTPPNRETIDPNLSPLLADTEAGTSTKPRAIYYSQSRGALSQINTAIPDRLLSRTLELSFEDAPVTEVAKAILAEALEQPLSIADGVSGTITLRSPGVVPAAEALQSLETALSASGLVLLQDDAGYILARAEQAKGVRFSVGGMRSPIGYGLAFAPVLNGTPEDILPLIEPFQPDTVTAATDPSSGFIILKGPQTDIAATIEAIRTFDAPLLADRVVGLFEIRFADASTIADEIATVLTTARPRFNGRQSLTPMNRQNLLLVTARTTEEFNEIKSWIDKFDQPSGSVERRLRYYPVKNTPADALAAQVTAIFNPNVARAGAVRRAQNNSRGIPQQDRGQPRPAGAPIAPPPLPIGGVGNTAGFSIVTDDLNNALVIRATDREYVELLPLLERMDAPAPQVLIEAVIAEVTLTEDLSYGIRWFFNEDRSSASFAGSAIGDINPLLPGFNYAFQGQNIQAALDLLSSVTDVTVLSAPSVMVLNNQTANLQVGDEVPIVTQQVQGVVNSDAPIVNSLQLRQTGVILEVTPRVNTSERVILDVTQEVSDVTQTTTSGIDSPTIQQRRFTSSVAVRDQSTIALGGLIRETFTDRSTGIPLLQDVPVVGDAFKSRSVNSRRTELIVFLTPQIIRSETDEQRAIDDLKSKMRGLTRTINLDARS